MPIIAMRMRYTFFTDTNFVIARRLQAAEAIFGLMAEIASWSLSLGLPKARPEGSQ